MKPSDLPTDSDSLQLQQQQCLLYLLGELSSVEQADFEDQLARSPRLGEILLAQADCLCELSSMSASAELASSEPTCVAESSNSSPSWLTLPRLIAAVAATLLVAITAALYPISGPIPTLTTDSSSSNMEADPVDPTMVALHWAESSLVDTNDDSEVGIEPWDPDSSLNASLALDEEGYEADLLAHAEAADEFESSFDWIYTAVASNPEILAAGDSHEG